MNFYKKLLIFNAIAFVFVMIVGGWVLWRFDKFLNTPASSQKKKIYMQIRRGESVYNIIKRLKKKGLITRSDWFYYYVRLSSASRSIKAGLHLFYTNYTPKDVLKELENANIHVAKVAVIEGWTIKDIAKRLSKKGFDGEGFLKLCDNASFSKKLTGLDIQSMEGFLFPDTYYLEKFEKPQKIILLMLGRFRDVFHSITGRRKLSYEDYKKLIIASIIEKETPKKKDKPLVVSVIYNRLKKHMPLQMDSTVIYGIKNFNGDLTKSDLDNKTNPYNTYAHIGLPPTPICNPGYDSLYAAYHPAKSDYLYFVSKNGRDTIFSKTLKEHNRWVRKYQMH